MSPEAMYSRFYYGYIIKYNHVCLTVGITNSFNYTRTTFVHLKTSNFFVNGSTLSEKYMTRTDLGRQTNIFFQHNVYKIIITGSQHIPRKPIRKSSSDNVIL